ncbi:SCP2 sterol-binding domain-containing protein [Marinibactrum halimedae]|uniref:SCP2 domain-containing protein n=1 Tax=Marinibactrum halimedae TaxID=1444977 RepID=A0AA37T885_9GAMM|nr:SCP2 sterol-binding domain-containing protein [Marinibactrum halimedae]MCD9459422.1 SCP2 sterol-binding domain-containing protein [Marinibactrum halimedae]GLS27511.1 hypothetical protein GCM10007877_32300 [Marinibactrum halimedae]
MSDLSDLFANLTERLDLSRSARLHEVIQFVFPDAGDYFVEISGGAAKVAQGNHSKPSLILTMDQDTFIGIMNGKFGGMQAFMFGKVRAEGNVKLATQLGELFPPPSNP